MFDGVSPVVLDGHRLQGVEETVIVEAVHLLGVILKTKACYTPDYYAGRIL